MMTHLKALQEGLSDVPLKRPAAAHVATKKPAAAHVATNKKPSGVKKRPAAQISGEEKDDDEDDDDDEKRDKDKIASLQENVAFFATISEGCVDSLARPTQGEGDKLPQQCGGQKAEGEAHRL